jgi:hypothetical protein
MGIPIVLAVFVLVTSVLVLLLYGKEVSDLDALSSSEFIRP